MVIKYGAAPKRFQSKWDTTQAGSANDTVVLPLVSDGSYNFRIDWGDGKANRDNITVYNQSEVTHQYDDTGIYTIKVVGDITGWRFNTVGDDDKIMEISKWGPLKFVSDDTDLFQPNDVKKLLENAEPDIVINAAAKVGGILYNDTKRVEFLLENLKINIVEEANLEGIFSLVKS